MVINGTPAYYIRLSTWEPELIIIMSELVWIAYTRPQNGVDSDGLPGISSGFLGWNSLQTNQPINYPAGSHEQSLFGAPQPVGDGGWSNMRSGARGQCREKLSFTITSGTDFSWWSFAQSKTCGLLVDSRNCPKTSTPSKPAQETIQP